MIHTLIHASMWVSNAGCNDARAVLYRTDREFVVHTQVKHPDGHRYFVHGHYCDTLLDAAMAFNDKCELLGVVVPNVRRPETLGGDTWAS